MTNAPATTHLTLEDLRARREEILAIAERHQAYNVRVFGSVARGEAGPGSDVDLLVTYRQNASLFDVAGLWLDLKEFLNCDVDVVDDAAIKARLRDSILQTAVPL